jgi:oxygen-dependent protoporphyrinogen oxidase
MKTNLPIAIIGAGITGLTAACELKKAGHRVRVFESSDRAGGVIRTIRREGYQVECGPNTLLETDPKIPEFIRQLGLGDQMLYSDPAAGKRWIVRGGKPVPMPSSPGDFFGGDLFSAKAKIRLMAEPFIRRSPPEWDESLAHFVVRRLGPEFLHYAIDPFVSGVYAGNPEKLSVREAFAKVHQLEQRYGSLILGQILGARERRKRGTVSKQNAPKVSFKLGLNTLTDGLAARLTPELSYCHTLLSMTRHGSAWTLAFNSPGGVVTEQASAVLVTVPAHTLAAIPIVTQPAASLDFLNSITYAPVSTLAFGFRRDQVRHPLDGFGFLVPGVEKLNILGAIFASSLFPDRAPAGHVLIGAYAGGLRSPDLPFRATGEQIALALQDLRNLLGISGQPTFTHHILYPKAIPQYEVGYSAIRRQMDTVENRCPGLFLGGNYRGGISLSDSILNGMAFAHRISEHLINVQESEQAIAA